MNGIDKNEMKKTMQQNSQNNQCQKGTLPATINSSLTGGDGYAATHWSTNTENIHKGISKLNLQPHTDKRFNITSSCHFLYVMLWEDTSFNTNCIQLNFLPWRIQSVLLRTPQGRAGLSSQISMLVSSRRRIIGIDLQHDTNTAANTKTCRVWDRNIISHRSLH